MTQAMYITHQVYDLHLHLLY